MPRILHLLLCPGQSLFEFVKEEAATWRSRGLIEAFSVQVPERTGKELIEVVPAIKTFQPVQESFLDSLLWRKPENIGDVALKYMNDTMVRTREYFHDRLIRHSPYIGSEARSSF